MGCSKRVSHSKSPNVGERGPVQRIARFPPNLTPCTDQLPVGESSLDLPPVLTQTVKTQNPFKGELSHGVVTQVVHQRVQAGRGAAAGARGFHRRSGAGGGGQSQPASPLAAGGPEWARPCLFGARTATSV